MKNFSQLPAAVDTNLVAAEPPVMAQQAHDDTWIQTSMRMRKQTRSEVKLYAITHDMTMQDVIDLAVKEYLIKYRNK